MSVRTIIDSYASIERSPINDEAWYNYQTRKLYCFTAEEMEQVIEEIDDFIEHCLENKESKKKKVKRDWGHLKVKKKGQTPTN